MAVSAEQRIFVIKRSTSSLLLDTENAAENEKQTDLKISRSNLTLRADDRRNVLSAETFQHIKDLCRVLQTQSCTCDVKLLVFASAANSADYRGTLVPIPPLFICNTFHDIDQLRRLIATWPSCNEMLQQLRTLEPSEINASYLNLLHWVLIVQANPILRRYKKSKLAGLCKDLHLNQPSWKPYEVLSVHYKDELRWSKSKHRFVFVGCPLQFLYRLLILGRMDNNWTGPLRFYNQVEPALAQCTVTKLPLPLNCWSHSRFGRAPRCVLICELLQDGQHMPQQPNEFVMEDLSGLRIRYLLIFTEVNRSSEYRLSTRESEVTSSTINTLIFKNRFNESNERQRFRGNCASRWIFHAVGSLMGRIAHLVRRQRTTF